MAEDQQACTGVAAEGLAGQAVSRGPGVRSSRSSRRAKFRESVDVAVNLGIDAKKSDQIVRGSTVLPHGTGKTVRVAVFAQGANADAAKAAGADVVGFEDLAEQACKGGDLIDFDAVIADAGRDARRRQAGSRPRSAGPDAEPQGRHRLGGRRRPRSRTRRPARFASAPTRPASCIARSARWTSRSTRLKVDPNLHALLTDRAQGQSPPNPKGILSEETHVVEARWGRVFP